MIFDPESGGLMRKTRLIMLSYVPGVNKFQYDQVVVDGHLTLMPEAWRITICALRLQYPMGRVTAGSELALALSLVPFSFTCIPRRRLTLLLPVEKGCDNGFKISSDLNHTNPHNFVT